MKSIIVDTGFWVALNNVKDRHHKLAVDCLRKYSKARLITTWPVMTETTYLLANRLGSQALLSFLQLYKNNAFDLFEINVSHADALIEMIKKYAGLPMDLADASLVLLASFLGHGDILSTDERDFNTYRWKQRKPFKNLLLTA